MQEKKKALVIWHEGGQQADIRLCQSEVQPCDFTYGVCI